jgi:transposase
MNASAPAPPGRYLAVDLHKDYVVIGGLDVGLNVVLAPKRLTLAAWPEWAAAHLRRTDQLVVESTSNAFDFYDQVAPLIGRAVVANPAKIALIASSRVKTDKADTLWLARLLAAGLIPEVWVPPAAVRELRSLLAHRQRLIQSRTRLRNRLQGVLQRHQLAGPDGDPFALAQRSFWTNLAVSPTEHLRVRHDLAQLDHLQTHLAELQAELERLSTVAPWAESLPYLLQLPGVGLIVASRCWRASATSPALPTPRNWSAMPGWAAACMTAAKPTAPVSSPKPAGARCAGRWWKPPGGRWTTTRPGKTASSVSKRAWRPTRPSSPLPINS